VAVVTNLSPGWRLLVGLGTLVFAFVNYRYLNHLMAFLLSTDPNAPSNKFRRSVGTAMLIIFGTVFVVSAFIDWL
jgi:hypothetical protein